MDHLKLTGVGDVSATTEVGVHITDGDDPDRPSVILRESPGVGGLKLRVPHTECLDSDGGGGGDDGVAALCEPGLHLVIHRPVQLNVGDANLSRVSLSHPPGESLGRTVPG